MEEKKVKLMSIVRDKYRKPNSIQIQHNIKKQLISRHEKPSPISMEKNQVWETVAAENSYTE